MEGCIFNIQKFSLHDGPGIRTTVFFKGCNQQCKWCSNPESQSLCPQPTLDIRKCCGCAACIDACNYGARSKRDGKPVVDIAKCIGCGACVQVCPTQAIAVEGRRATVKDVLEECIKDKAFYDHSGGGVTFSGGEVFLQQAFATELARALHANGISVAIETAAAVDNDRFSAFLREIDYAFVDMKHYDSEAHRAGTGVGNEQIIENIRTLTASGLNYTVRIPVIPGYNDSLEDACGFAGLLAELGAKRVQLLPFHQLGERKYQLLGKDYAYAGQKQLHRDDLQDYCNVFARHGIETEL